MDYLAPAIVLVTAIALFVLACLWLVLPFILIAKLNRIIELLGARPQAQPEPIRAYVYDPPPPPPNA